MSNEIVTPNSGVPDWAKKASTGASLGNIDSSDLKPPRLKILAGQSPEVTDGKPNAVPGNFWLTIIDKNLGPSVTGTLILVRKSYQLWAPRGGSVDGRSADSRGPLATASDGIHWDIPNQEFKVRHYGIPKEYTWRILKTVAENKMHKFGSSQDDNPASKPAATLTYDMLWLIDLPDGRKQLAVFTSSRTGTIPTQNFISTITLAGADHYYQRFRIVVQKRTGPTGDPYFSYEYQAIGQVPEQEGPAMKHLYEQYRKIGFATDLNDEGEEIRADKRKDWGQAPDRDEMENIPF